LGGDKEEKQTHTRSFQAVNTQDSNPHNQPEDVLYSQKQSATDTTMTSTLLAISKKLKR